MVILGIDPGLATVGIGIIETECASSTRRRVMLSGVSVANEDEAQRRRSAQHDTHVLDWCTIQTEKGLTLSQRLLEISDDLAEIIRKHKPELAVVEKLYFEANRKTAIDVAQARGVILATVEEAGIPLIEPTPLQLKSAVTGDGRADKKQMQNMIERILGEKCPSDDAADALGLAVYGALHSSNVIPV